MRTLLRPQAWVVIGSAVFFAMLVATALLLGPAPNPQPHCADMTDPNAEAACVMRVITAPDDGVPVQPGIPCRHQPSADSMSRCVLATYPPPADTHDGAAMCAWQRQLYAAIDVPLNECSWDGKDY